MNKTILLLLFFVFACNTEKIKEHLQKKEYSQTVGDIELNLQTDNPSFKSCHDYPSSPQYYWKGGLKYKGEISAIRNEINSKYKSPNIKGESGYFTIRFLVNCEGKTGLFRYYTTDFDLKEIKLSEQITTPLSDFTKALNGWKIWHVEGNSLDYYQYLTFKIIDSEIIEILP